MRYRKFPRQVRIVKLLSSPRYTRETFFERAGEGFGARIVDVLEATWNPEKSAAWNSIKESLGAKARFERDEISLPI